MVTNMPVTYFTIAWATLAVISVIGLYFFNQGRNVFTFLTSRRFLTFFIVASIGLWLDSLINGVVGRHAEQASLYKVLMIVVLVVSIFGYIFLKLFMLTQTPAFSSLVEYCKSHFLSNLICSSLLYRAG